MIDGHIDSIPLHSPERWSVDPFGGEIRDGSLYGLGICDQKASIAAAIWGVAAAAPRLSSRVVVVASVCEEEMEGGALAEPIAAAAPGRLRHQRAQRHPAVHGPAGAGEDRGAGDGPRLPRRARRASASTRCTPWRP